MFTQGAIDISNRNADLLNDSKLHYQKKHFHQQSNWWSPVSCGYPSQSQSLFPYRQYKTNYS